MSLCSSLPATRIIAGSTLRRSSGEYSAPPSNDRRSVEPGLYMLMKCQKAAVRRKLRDRNPDLFSAFEILDHTRGNHDIIASLFSGGSALKIRASRPEQNGS